MSGKMADFYKPIAYGLLNVVSASGIVFANKAVMTTFGFHFIYALTLIHTLATLVGMKVFAYIGMYEKKRLPKMSVASLAAAYVGYIVLNNLNLQMNTVGFYQISKIAVAPAVLAAEAVFFGKRASRKVVAAIVIVCLGVGLSTITDTQMGSNLMGWAVGGGAIASTALYQIWAGTKQKELGAGSMQVLNKFCTLAPGVLSMLIFLGPMAWAHSDLLNEYSPIAAGFLGVLIPIFEPVGWAHAEPGTLLGYQYSAAAIVAIAVSAGLGLLVSLSTFLVIGATSSLTYNVVGHIKTVIILMGGCMFFGDQMPLKKLAGISIAMSGIIWYSQLKLQQVAQASREKLPTYLPVPTSETNGAAINGHFGGNHEGSVTKTSSRSSSIKTADLK